MSEVLKSAADLQEGANLFSKIANLDGWKEPSDAVRGETSLYLDKGDCFMAKNSQDILIRKGDSELHLMEDGRVTVDNSDLATVDPDTYNRVVTSLYRDLDIYGGTDVEVQREAADVRKKLSGFLNS